ncbi:zinc finger protein 385B isoform X4 [Syngnathus typhle]|uniref:zinc finger protein 385B isoform X4 n=1 Tax=Syngnathus typhle TaxID=161592 RepID=UPI002A6A4A97|nr:zinc finger protein 385B isoform X4 [Syngnathus typhle]
MRSYNGRVSFKIPRRMSSATEPPCNVQYGEHHSDHYSALPGAAASGYNSSDVNLLRFAQESGFQRGPWKPNRPEGLCCCPAHEGHMCTTLAAALPGLLGAAGGPGGIMMKPYSQFAVNSDGAAPPAAIPPAHVYPHFSTMDPVHKAVIKHAFGVRRGAAKARRKRPVDCGVCRLTFNSDSQAEAHYRGGRHAKKLKMQRCTEDAKDGSSCDTGPAAAADSNAGGDHNFRLVLAAAKLLRRQPDPPLGPSCAWTNSSQPELRPLLALLKRAVTRATGSTGRQTDRQTSTHARPRLASNWRLDTPPQPGENIRDGSDVRVSLPCSTGQRYASGRRAALPRRVCFVVRSSFTLLRC